MGQLCALFYFWRVKQVKDLTKRETSQWVKQIESFPKSQNVLIHFINRSDTFIIIKIYFIQYANN